MRITHILDLSNQPSDLSQWLVRDGAERWGYKYYVAMNIYLIVVNSGAFSHEQPTKQVILTYFTIE